MSVFNRADFAKDWQIVKFGKITKESLYGPRFSASLYTESGNAKTIRGMDFSADGEILYEQAPIAQLDEKLISRHQLQHNDLIIVTTADCGLAAIFKKQNIPFIASAYTVRYRLKLDLVHADFIKYLMLTSVIQKQIQSFVRKGTVGNLPGSDVLKIKIPLPPRPEQEKIAEILGTWDKALAQTERLIALEEQRKKGLMQRLLTGQVRFPEFAGRPWQEVRLGEYADVRRGASPRPIKDPKWFSEEGRGWIRISDITSSTSRYLNKTSQYLSPLGVEKSVPVEVGDLILSIAATVGVPKIVNIPACIHDGFVTFSNYREHFDTDFLFYYLSSLTDRLSNSGQPGTQRNLNSKLVRRIEVPYTSLEEQRKIAAVLQTCDEKITLLQQKLAALQQQKKGLMQRLLTGQLRVKV